jgi:hypothetical protein
VLHAVCRIDWSLAGWPAMPNALKLASDIARLREAIDLRLIGD